MHWLDVIQRLTGGAEGMSEAYPALISSPHFTPLAARCPLGTIGDSPSDPEFHRRE